MVKIKFNISSTGKPSLEYSTGDILDDSDIEKAQKCDEEAWVLYKQNKEKILKEYMVLQHELRGN